MTVRVRVRVWVRVQARVRVRVRVQVRVREARRSGVGHEMHADDAEARCMDIGRRDAWT